MKDAYHLSARLLTALDEMNCTRRGRAKERWPIVKGDECAEWRTVVHFVELLVVVVVLVQVPHQARKLSGEQSRGNFYEASCVQAPLKPILSAFSKYISYYSASLIISVCSI